jgi:hypothetical protein
LPGLSVPLLITNSFFMKFHPLTVVSHTLGWLARLAVCGGVAGFFLKGHGATVN